MQPIAPVSNTSSPQFDPLVVNPGRLNILMTLAGTTRGAGLEFVDLRRQTRLTDGNLATHARRLHAGGLIDIAKQFREGKPVTTYRLTSAGGAALQSHVRCVTSAVTAPPAIDPVRAASPVYDSSDEDWVD